MVNLSRFSSSRIPFPLSLPHFLGDDYARCSYSGPGLWRCRSMSGAQVFFGPFTGDEHPQGTPYPFSSPNLGYLYPDLI